MYSVVAVLVRRREHYQFNFFFSSRRRHTRLQGDWSSDVCSSDLWRVVYLDGIHFKIRHGDKCDTSIILTALGVDLEGKKEVLALRACAEEDKEGWLKIGRASCRERV